MNHVVSYAPGRVCLFGDHQDYLELPIIACAINRMMRLDAYENGCDYFEINMPDMGMQRIIPIHQDSTKPERGDFLKTALKVLSKREIIPTKGYRLTIKSDIPINAGLSSSSALTIAWIQFLIKAFSDQSFSAKELALMAYETEVIEQGSSGGKMDQFTIAMGNTIFLDTHTDEVQSFSNLDLNLVVGVSGLGKDTFGTLSHLKTNALKSIEKVKEKYPKFDVTLCQPSEIDSYMELLEDDLKPFFHAAVGNHNITQKALIALKNDPTNLEQIGHLMDEHHHFLKNYLKITPPLMDQMVDAAKAAGAMGCKIVGSGGGGCIVAICPNMHSEKIVHAIKASGAADAFAVKIIHGASLKQIEND